MTPRNFPARVNARRIGALDRLFPYVARSQREHDEAAALQTRIVTEEVARARRTKIRRGDASTHKWR